MYLKVLRSKIHRATVTQSDVDYIGSITIDRELMDAAGIVPGQCLLVTDLNNAARFETYVLSGDPGSGIICVNGAAAKLAEVGDKVIIMAFAYADPDQARRISPQIILVDEKNRIDPGA